MDKHDALKSYNQPLAWSSLEFLWERERREKEQQLSFLGIMGDRFRLIRFKVFLDVINKLK